jgi:cell division protein FtsA
MHSMVSEDETIEVASVGGRAPRVLSRQMLCRDIIQPRVEEMFSFVKAEVARLGCEDMLASGAVITGGATQLPGMAELGEEILGIPVRLGVPKGVGGLAEVVKAPGFSTGVGLVQYGARQQGAIKPIATPARPGLFGRMRKAISSAF